MMDLGEQAHGVKFMIRDCGSNFTAAFNAVLAGAGIRTVDVIRPHPDVVALLRHVEDENFLDELPALAGGREARDAIQAHLDKYGMRCVGEIDITKPRWSERPTTLVPMILANIKNFEPGAGERRFEQGRLPGGSDVDLRSR